MGWITILWIMIAAASATVALIHGYAWSRLPRAPQYGAFFLCAAGVSMVALAELAMMRSSTPEAFGYFLWLNHFPLWVATIGSVLFVRVHMKAGRQWLAWSAIGLRTLVMLTNAVSTPNLNFRAIHSVEPMQILDETLYYAQGTPNPLFLLALAAGLMLSVFIIDATIEVWRRGDLRLVMNVGAWLTVFVLVGIAGSVLRVLGLVQFQAVITLSCVPIIIALGFEASRELVQSIEMSSALKARHLELKESEDSLQLAAEAARVALWSVDTSTGEFWLTGRAAEMFGFTPGQRVFVDDVLDRVHPDDRPLVREKLTFSPVASEPSAEYRVRLPDGDERWFSSLAGLQQATPEVPAQLTGVTIDITERRRAELESERRRIELERLERVASASEFSAAMAHELSQPLAIIMSNAEAAQRMLQRPAPNLDELRAVFMDIVAADQRAADVLARLRELPGQDEIRALPFSVNQLVDEVLTMMSGDLAEHGVSVSIQVVQAMADAAGDRMLIGQVLINLIRNACQAMSDSAPAERQLVIATAVIDGMVEIRVSDLGSGLPVDPSQIFAPFFTTKADGLGVGLAICRSIMNAHGGSITAQPNGRRGASFVVRLPLSRETAASTVTSAATEATS